MVYQISERCSKCSTLFINDDICYFLYYSGRYKKTSETLTTAGQRTSAAFSNLGTAITRKFGDMRYNVTSPSASFCCPIISCFFFSAGISHKHLVHMLCMLHSEMAVVLRRLPRTVCLRGMFVLCKPHLSSFQWARLGAVPAGKEMRACDGMKNLSAPLHWLLDS